MRPESNIPIDEQEPRSDYNRFLLELVNLEDDTITFYPNNGFNLGTFLEPIFVNTLDRQEKNNSRAQSRHEVITVVGRPYSGKSHVLNAMQRMIPAIGIDPDNVQFIKWDNAEKYVREVHNLTTDSLDKLPDELLDEVNIVLEDQLHTSLDDSLLTVVEMPFSAAANISDNEDEEEWIGRKLGEPALLHFLEDTNPKKVNVNFIGLAPGPTLSLLDPEIREEGAPPEMVDYMFNLMRNFAIDLADRGEIALPDHIKRALPGIENVHTKETDAFFQRLLSGQILNVTNVMTKNSKRRKLLEHHIQQTNKLTTETSQSLASLYIMTYLCNQFHIPKKNTYIGLMNPLLPKVLSHFQQEQT